MAPAVCAWWKTNGAEWKRPVLRRREPGMEIYTNTPKLRKYRKMILELLLSNHCSSMYDLRKERGLQDCRSWRKRFGIDKLRFPKQPEEKNLVDDSSPCYLPRPHKMHSVRRLCAHV